MNNQNSRVISIVYRFFCSSNLLVIDFRNIMALSSKLSKFQILKEIWLDFEQDFFDSETIEDKTPMFLILITVSSH